MINSIRSVDTPEDFTRWATSAKKGHRICYYRGWLMKDKLSKMPTLVKGTLSVPEFRTADKAWDFYRVGSVELFQKRVGDEDYLYIAVKK